LLDYELDFGSMKAVVNLEFKGSTDDSKTTVPALNTVNEVTRQEYLNMQIFELFQQKNKKVKLQPWVICRRRHKGHFVQA